MEGSEITRIEHYQSIAEQTGQDPPELDGPEIPDIVAHVWEWFLELNAARGEGLLSYSEIGAWADLTGHRITPFEIRLLKILDIEFLTQQTKTHADRHRKIRHRA